MLVRDCFSFRKPVMSLPTVFGKLAGASLFITAFLFRKAGYPQATASLSCKDAAVYLVENAV